MAFFAICASCQSAHYSVLCSLSRESKKSTEVFADLTFGVEISKHVISNIKATPTEAGRRVLILRDISGSMSDGKDRFSLEAIRSFAQFSSTTDKLGLIDFSDEPHIEIDLQDADSFSRRFNDFIAGGLPKSYGHSAIFDGLYGAASDLQKAPREGDSLLIFSDGDDNASKTNREKLRELLLGSKIRVYWFSFPTFGLPKPDQVWRSAIAEIVTDTGGQIIVIQNGGPQSVTQLRPQAELLHDLIERALRVEFDVDSPLTKLTKLNMSVRNRNGKKAEGVRLSCPTYLGPN